MIKRTTKLKWRRLLRRRKKQVTEIGNAGEQNFEKLFVRRLIRLPKVLRFMAGWVGLLVLLTIGLIIQSRALAPKYQTVQPKPGGTYTEGMLGTFTNAN